MLVLKTQSKKNISLAWSPDGKRLVCGGDGSAELWNLANPGKSKVLAIPSPWRPLPKGEGSQIGRVEQIVWRPDSKQFATRSCVEKDQSRPVLLWDAEGNPAAFPKMQATDIYWSPDGKSLLACNQDKSIRSWHTGEEDALPAWEVDGEKFVRADGNPDGKWLSSDSEDGAIRLWRTDEQPQTILKAAVTDHGCRFWSPDSRWLALIMPDQSIQLWDLEIEKAGLMLRGHRGRVTDISWEADSRGLVSSDGYGTLRRWDVPSGESLWTGVALPAGRAARIDQGGKLDVSDPQAEAELTYLVEQPGGRLKHYNPAEFRQLAKSLGWAEKAGFAQGLAADEERRKADKQQKQEQRKAEEAWSLPPPADDDYWTAWQDLFDGKTLERWKPNTEAWVSGKVDVQKGCIVLDSTSGPGLHRGISRANPSPELLTKYPSRRCARSVPAVLVAAAILVRSCSRSATRLARLSSADGVAVSWGSNSLKAPRPTQTTRRGVSASMPTVGTRSASAS